MQLLVAVPKQDEFVRELVQVDTVDRPERLHVWQRHLFASENSYTGEPVLSHHFPNVPLGLMLKGRPSLTLSLFVSSVLDECAGFVVRDSWDLHHIFLEDCVQQLRFACVLSDWPTVKCTAVLFL